MGKNKKKHVQESKSATASATIPTTNSEAVKNPKAGQDRLTKAVFKQNADGTPVAQPKVFYSKRMDEKGLEARQRLKKVLEHKGGPPTAATSSESRLPIPNPNHVNSKEVKRHQLNDSKPHIAKPDDYKPNDVKQNYVKPCDVATAGSSSKIVNSRPEKTYPNPTATDVGQTLKDFPKANLTQNVARPTNPDKAKSHLDVAQLMRPPATEPLKHTFETEDATDLDGEVDDWKDIADYIEMKINNAFIAAQRKRVVDGIVVGGEAQFDKPISCSKELAKLVEEAISKPLIKRLSSMLPGCVGETTFGHTTDDLPEVDDKESAVEKTPNERFVDRMVKKYAIKTGADKRFVEETVRKILTATEKFANSFDFDSIRGLGLDEESLFLNEEENEEHVNPDNPTFRELSSDSTSANEPICQRNPSQKKRKFVENEALEPKHDPNSRLLDSQPKVLETPEERYLQKTYCENDDKVVVYAIRNQNESISETLAPVIKSEEVPEQAPKQVPAKSTQAIPLNPSSHQQLPVALNQEKDVSEALKPRRMLNKRTYDQIPPTPPRFQPQMPLSTSLTQFPSASTSFCPRLGRYSTVFDHTKNIQQIRSDPQTSAKSPDFESDPLYQAWYNYSDDELQKVIEMAESMKSYNRNKKSPQTDETLLPRHHYGISFNQIDPLSEAYILAATIETELLRTELFQEKTMRQKDKSIIESCRDTIRRNKNYIDQLKLLIMSCTEEALQYRNFDLVEREWFLTLMDTLNCTACNLVLDEPVVINCGHVFCSACIDPERNPHGGELPLTCPECSSMISLRAPARKIDKLLDKLNEIFDDYKLENEKAKDKTLKDAETSE